MKEQRRFILPFLFLYALLLLFHTKHNYLEDSITIAKFYLRELLSLASRLFGRRRPQIRRVPSQQ